MGAQFNLIGVAIEQTIRAVRENKDPVTYCLVRRNYLPDGSLAPDTLVPLLGNSVVYDSDNDLPEKAPVDLKRLSIMGPNFWADSPDGSPVIWPRRLVIVEGHMQVVSYGKELVVERVDGPQTELQVDDVGKSKTTFDKVPKEAKKLEKTKDKSEFGWSDAIDLVQSQG